MLELAYIDSELLPGIADAIRAKTGETALLLPSQMAAAIEAIPVGGGIKSASGTFVLAEDAQTYEVTHNLGVIPDLVIVEAEDHDNTAYSIFGFFALRQGIFRCTLFGGMVLTTNVDGNDKPAFTNKNGESAFNQGLSDTKFVCAYNSYNYKYRAGWTYKWTVFSGLINRGVS